jgi:hypothetical protein
MQLKEKSEQEQESESTNEGKEMLKLFSNLTKQRTERYVKIGRQHAT